MTETWTRLPEQGNALRGHFATAHEALMELPRAIFQRNISTVWVHRVEDGYDIYITEARND